MAVKVKLESGKDLSKKAYPSSFDFNPRFPTCNIPIKAENKSICSWIKKKD